MANDGYRYTLQLYRADGAALGQAAVEVDWEPAREWARFQAVRRCGTAAIASGAVSEPEPLWHESMGAPFIEGFRMTVALPGGGECASDFPVRYFNALASAASARLVESGALKNGDRYQYAAAAFPNGAAGRAAEAQAFQVEEEPPELPVAGAEIGRYLRDSALVGQEEAADLKVFVPDYVLEEAVLLAREAPGRETGGVLVGHLRRDPEISDIFAEVTAQLPARHTVSEAAKLTFTPATWTGIRAALNLRRRGELMLGWWHSHPVRDWCPECPPEKKRRCRLARDFYSEHDMALHRAVFPAAFTIGLVLNGLGGDDATFSAFGWRRGMLEPRGFRVLGAAADMVRRPAAETVTGEQEKTKNACART